MTKYEIQPEWMQHKLTVKALMLCIHACCVLCFVVKILQYMFRHLLECFEIFLDFLNIFFSIFLHLNLEIF